MLYASYGITYCHAVDLNSQFAWYAVYTWHQHLDDDTRGIHALMSEVHAERGCQLVLKIRTSLYFLNHETVWFASGDYDPKLYPADVTYFRQHRLSIPRKFVMSSEPFSTLFLDLSTGDLWKGLSWTTRYDVNRGAREGIRFVESQKGTSSIVEFCQRHRIFSKAKSLAKGLLPHNKVLLPRDLERVKEHWSLNSAFMKDIWLADLLVIHDDDRARLWVITNNLDHNPRSIVGYASKSLVWRSICDAKTKGFGIYDFGGVILDENDPRYGVTRFKQSFGGYVVTEKNSIVVYNPIFRIGYRIASRLKDAMETPVQRLIPGHTCIRSSSRVRGCVGQQR